MKKFIVQILLLTVLIIFDQITKAIFADRDFFIMPVHFHLVKNYGLPFGLDFGPNINLIIIVFALSFFVFYFVKNKPKFLMTLILAGAVSNLIDRAMLGYVRDFIDLGLGFSFNFADVLIVAGLIFVLIKSNHIQSSLEDNTKKQSA